MGRPALKKTELFESVRHRATEDLKKTTGNEWAVIEAHVRSIMGAHAEPTEPPFLKRLRGEIDRAEEEAKKYPWLIEDPLAKGSFPEAARAMREILSRVELNWAPEGSNLKKRTTMAERTLLVRALDLSANLPGKPGVLTPGIYARLSIGLRFFTESHAARLLRNHSRLTMAKLVQKAIADETETMKKVCRRHALSKKAMRIHRDMMDAMHVIPDLMREMRGRRGGQS